MGTYMWGGGRMGGMRGVGGGGCWMRGVGRGGG